MTVSAACGDKTANLCNEYVTGYYIDDSTGNARSQSNSNATVYIDIEPNTAYYITPTQSGNWGAWYDENKTYISGFTGYGVKTSPNNAKYIRCTANYDNKNPNYIDNFMIAKSGQSIPYEPYGYKIPILCGETTSTIYISEPLRKALDSSGLYDTIESSGVLTRRVDSSGDALATPTTEQITVPTITTTSGSQTFNIDTTLKPSEVDLTYTGWHLYNDKKRTSGEWV